METSFFEFRLSPGRDASISEDANDESMRSVDAIDESMRSDESYSLLRSVPPSARKLARTVVDESEDDDDRKASRSIIIPKFSLGGADSDTSFIGRKPKRGARRGRVLSDSGSDTDYMTPDDDMVMSAATRMSISGFRPRDMGDESDYIESDDAKSGLSSRSSSLSELPAVELSHYSDTKTSPPATHDDYPDTPRSNENIKRESSRREGLSGRKKESFGMKEEFSGRKEESNFYSIKKESSGIKEEFSGRKEESHFYGIKKESSGIKERFSGTKEENDINTRKNGNKNLVKYDNHQMLVADVDIDLSCNDDFTDVKEVTSSTSNRSSASDLPEIDLTQYEEDKQHIVERADITRIKASKKTDYSKHNSNELMTRFDQRELFEIKREADNSEDVQFVEQDAKIVTLISDDDDDIEMTSLPSSPQPKPDIRKYLMPKSYPNAGVVYVAPHIKINETNKLKELREGVDKIKYLLESVAEEDLPDGGRKLKERLTKMEAAYRIQAEKIAAMVVEPDEPTARDTERDGFGAKAEPSWDELHAASGKVQPKMFGQQAMSTHIAERGVILERLRDLHESLRSRPAETKHAPQPLALRATLMPHQTHALAWLRWRETQRPRGGILADDMGLGKTLTMISLIVSDKEHSLEEEQENDRWNSKENSRLVAGGTLVVCPASLLQQWAGEVERHCRPHFLSVCQHHGSARATQPYKLSSHDMVITTYNIVGRDLEKNGVLMRIRWSRVILDEAHIVRNHKALMSRAVSALEARRRWCLTGTPVQNKELDIFALLKFMRCTPFDEIQMWKKWIDNKSAGGQERLAIVMRTLLLRRTKLQLQTSGALTCLPERTAHPVQLTLTKEEMNVYQKVLVFSKTLFAQFLQQRAEKHANMDGGFLAPMEKDSAYYKMHKKMVALQGARPVKSHEILVLLLRLRQLCCHAGLITAMLDPDADEHSDDNSDPAGLDLLSELNKLSIEDEEQDETLNGTQEDVADEGTTVAEAIRSVLSPSNPVFSFERPSSKINAVLKCLQENVLNKPREKAVVVSQWTSVLSLVERELREACITCSTLSGAVPVPARAALVDKFNDPSSDVNVLLLSLCAGGVGLNLCGANHLLLLDPHWNPQLEEQAQDRIYRVGQTKPVHIYKFMCAETVEQSIKRLQEHKLELASNVLTGARHTNSSKLSIEDLKLLFNM